MAKRRSTDIEWWQTQQEARPLPAKRHAGSSYAETCASGRFQTSNGAASAFCLSAAVKTNSTSASLSQDGTMEVWLAVAAQVQDALAALPGWIPMTAHPQVEQPGGLSSLSSASTPLAMDQNETHSSLSQQHHQQLQQQEFLSLYHRTGSYGNAKGSQPPSLSSPAPGIRSLQSPVAPVAAATAPAPAPDFPAQPAARNSSALDSCASGSDTTGAACCGWFSKCRGCCQLTAGEVELHGEVVPLCRGCSSSLHRRPPAERDSVVVRIMRAHATLCQREAATAAGAAGETACAGAGPAACARGIGQASS